MRLARRVCRSSIVTAGLLATGCAANSTGLGACTTEQRPGLLVNVIDSVTLQPPASAILIATADIFTDSIGPSVPYQDPSTGKKSLLFNAAYETWGTFSIVVRSSGYRDWTGSAAVTHDFCHVQTMAVTARLVRSN